MTKKHFKRYDSIENAYREAFVDKIMFSGHQHEKFHVEEKIHGANFQFNVSDDGVVAGKRSGFISEGEKFFNWKPIFEKYKDAVEKMRNEKFPKHTVIFFGELYGGIYPHPEVTSDSKWTVVQREVYYRPDEDFICFDIFIHSEEESRFIRKSKRDKICQEYGIPYSKSLFTGSLSECMNYSNEFQSTIPVELGLPEIENNTCEGVVIRPELDLRVNTGERAILKNKNGKFSETKSKPKAPKKPEEVPDFILDMVEKADLYITENRLQNMISKIGDDLSPKKFGEYIKMFSADVYEDFFKDHSENFQNWEKGEQKRFQKIMNSKIVAFLKTHLLTKI